MKRKWIPGAAVFLLAIAIGWMLRTEAGGPRRTSSSAARATTATEIPEVAGEPGQRRTRSADRPPPQPKATHGPQQLQRFFLGELDFTGLALPEALEKIRGAYARTCALTGEVPLKLKFSIPPGNYPQLNFKSNHASVDTAVRFLAGIHGMTVKRHGLDYRFDIIESFPEEAIVSSATVDWLRTLGGPGSPPKPSDAVSEFSIERDLRGYLENLGMTLHPSTRFTAEGRIVSDSPRDIAAISSLVTQLPRLALGPQHTFQGKIIELSPDNEWQMPAISHLSEAEVQLEMRKLAQTKGTNLLTLPSITVRAGQSGDIKMIRELIAPNGDGHEVHEVGLVTNLNVSPIGFGHQADVAFTETTGELNPDTAEPEIHVKTSLSDSSYSPDAVHRVLVQTRPDGSRAVMFSKLQFVDPTGRPFAHPAE